MPPRNLDRLARIYGPATWDIYARLDASLNPRGPEWLHLLAAEYLRPGDVVLDAGCRDATHLVQLVQDNNAVRGVGIDPVELHVDRAHTAIADAGLESRISLYRGVVNCMPYPDGCFDFVWCRDVLEQVEDLQEALCEITRVMKPRARMLVYTIVKTDLIDGRDAEMLRAALGNIEDNLDRARLEASFRRAGLVIERTEMIGTEWRERAEEQAHVVSRKLLQLARLRRLRQDLIPEVGEELYAHIEANLHWELFQFIGKLLPIVYVLAPATGCH